MPSLCPRGDDLDERCDDDEEEEEEKEEESGDDFAVVDARREQRVEHAEGAVYAFRVRAQLASGAWTLFTRSLSFTVDEPSHVPKRQFRQLATSPTVRGDTLTAAAFSTTGHAVKRAARGLVGAPLTPGLAAIDLLSTVVSGGAGALSRHVLHSDLPEQPLRELKALLPPGSPARTLLGHCIRLSTAARGVIDLGVGGGSVRNFRSSI